MPDQKLLTTLLAGLLALGPCACNAMQTPVKEWQYTIGITVEYQADGDDVEKNAADRPQPGA